MIPRLLKPIKDHSFFLFGPRGAGKSTLINASFSAQNTLFINLLDQETLAQLQRHNGELKQRILALPESITHIVIDEVQKIPKLLDVVHDMIETTNKVFILTGSSARKLKRGGANLLAGRAFVFHLTALSYLEVTENFDLSQALHWGMLPQAYLFDKDALKKHYLEAYAHTYLKEEIWEEQFIRQLDPFRRFLEVAAQSNGKIINLSNIARDVGVSIPTVENYYSILEDTLLGFFLPAFVHSFRKRVNTKPKFFFFDVGVTRALAYLLNVPANAQTSYYGDLFEHFIILECIKLATYNHHDYRFSYFRTKDGVEVDLIVERPGKPLLFIEIKSASQINEKQIASFIRISKDFGDCEAICLSNDAYAKKIDHVMVLPWQEGIKQYFA